MISVRITAAGAVAVVFLAYLTAPVSACDERFIKKCERASAAAAAAVAAAESPAPAAKRKSARRVHVIVSRRAKHTRFTKRTRAPGFTARRERGAATASRRIGGLVPESALARRFRGFIDPQPLAQNAFEALRKPHLVAVNLEPPVALAQVDAAPPPPVSEASAAAEPATPSVITTAKQDRIEPTPAVMELAAAESKPVSLLEPPPARPFAIATANAAMAPAVPQAFVSAAPPNPTDPQPSRFSIHQLVLALCGALGAASALRFIVGA